VNLSRVDLNLLVALDALIRERNVTRAGRRVGLSQPAMSAALGRLRTLFADPLLERVGRDYRLTPLALDLSEPLQQILVSIERTLDHNTPFEPSEARRSFRIAASDYVICVLLKPLVEHIADVAPGIKVHIQRSETSTAKHLAARHIDLSIQPAGTHRSFETQKLFSDRWMCAIWRGNDEVGDQLSVEQLASLRHATYSLAPYGFTLAERCVASLARQLRVQVTSESFLALPLLVRGTRLVALIQSRLGEQLKDTAELRLLEPPVPIDPLVMSMWWNALYNGDAAHTWLRTKIVEVAQRS
jgi:LysR family transcriptional regulator, nod-box dependent transcriptional activator